MVEWHERFTNRLLSAVYGYSRVFQIVLACIGAGAVTIYWIGHTNPRVAGLLHIYFGYTTGFVYCVVGAAAVSFAVGSVARLMRPVAIRISETAVGCGSSNIPLREADSAVIHCRRFRVPVLWVTVDGKRRRFGLPKDPSVVLEVERILRSSGIWREEAPTPQYARAAQSAGSNRKMDEPATALGQDGGTVESMAGDDPAVSWSEGYLNNELFRWILPMLGYFVRLLFAFSGFGALVVHVVASTDPGLREKLFREYFGLDFAILLYCLIFFGCGGLFLGFRRSRREPARVRLTANRIELYERQISLFRVNVAEIVPRRLRGPLLRLLVDGRWVGVGLPQDENTIEEVRRSLRAYGVPIDICPGGRDGRISGR